MKHLEKDRDALANQIVETAGSKEGSLEARQAKIAELKEAHDKVVAKIRKEVDEAEARKEASAIRASNPRAEMEGTGDEILGTNTLIREMARSKGALVFEYPTWEGDGAFRMKQNITRTTEAGVDVTRVGIGYNYHEAISLRAFASKDLYHERDIATTTTGISGALPNAYAELIFNEQDIGPMTNGAVVRQEPLRAKTTEIPVRQAGGSASFVNENAAIGITDPSYKTIEVSPFKAGDAVAFSQETIEDEDANLVGDVREFLLEKITLLKNEVFTGGTGTNQPAGVVTALNAIASNVGVASQRVNKTAPTPAELTKAVHEVGGKYRTRSTIQMNASVFAALATHADSISNALGAFSGPSGGQNIPASQVDGRLQSFWGLPVWANPELDGLGTSNDVIVVGDHSGYRTLLGEIRLDTSSEAGFLKDQVVIRGIQRFAGVLTLEPTASIKNLLVVKTTA